MQYAGMSDEFAEPPTGAGKYGGPLSANQSLTDLQHAGQDDDDHPSAPSASTGQGQGQLTKSANAIKSSLIASENPRPVKRNFNYFDGNAELHPLSYLGGPQ